ncbi:type II toxin-antitoxin system Phd/YefM family antitoxin [Candidatus Poriferisodalis sp.]|uniref:type II toxin-antitoxin system Phd/YefM family antitoxin n=1 Tax=Candidatus Poriferisodalis sp. TaxID=3101277 RepID=UPI003B51772C
MSSVSFQAARNRFADLVERVHSDHERFVITRNDEPAAILINPEDLESLEETLAILSDPEEMQAIAEGEQAVERGDVVRGVEAVRALRHT